MIIVLLGYQAFILAHKVVIQLEGADFKLFS